MRLIISTIVFSLFTCVGFAQQNNLAEEHSSKPFILGSIHELQSKILNEKRILNIYLPEGYNASDSLKYPVIYLLDGSANEDFIHIVGLVQYNSFEWVNMLQKSIVVGIATVDRRRDFTFPTSFVDEKKAFSTSGHSENFIRFLEFEVQPYIEKHFQVTNHKTLIGQSLGGLLATEILINKPTLFNKYIIVSPSLWWNNGSLIEGAIKLPDNSLLNPIMVYVGVGKEGLTPGKASRVMEVDANILADKLKSLKKPDLQIVFDYLPFENHATIMHQAVLNAFKMFSGK